MQLRPCTNVSHFRRLIHTSVPLFTRWLPAEDELLLQKYDELGPAWTALSLSINSRSPTECRRRYLQLRGDLDKLPEATRKLISVDGYELHNGQLIKIPQERILSGPFARLAAAIPPVRFRSQRRTRGWSDAEIMALREGFEQYGPRWDFIAKRLQYRTGAQCRNFFHKRYVTHEHWSKFKEQSIKADLEKEKAHFASSQSPHAFSPESAIIPENDSLLAHNKA